MIGVYAITIEVCPKKRTYKRFDFDCMVIVDIYIKSLERMLMSTGWPMEKTLHPCKLFPYVGSTNLTIPMVTSSIVYQQAGQNTEEMPVVCDYPDASPQDLPVHHQEEIPSLILDFMCIGT